MASIGTSLFISSLWWFDNIKRLPIKLTECFFFKKETANHSFILNRMDIIGSTLLFVSGICLGEEKEMLIDIELTFSCILIPKFSSSLLDVEDLSVRVGSSWHANGGQIIKIDRIVNHPKYHFPAYDYDFSLLHLSETLKFNDVVQPIDLPDEHTEIPDGTLCITTGWGKLIFLHFFLTFRTSKFQLYLTL